MPLNELFNNHESNIDAQEKIAEMQSSLTHPRDNQIHKEIFYNNANLRNNEEFMMNNNDDVTSEEKFLNKRNQNINQIEEEVIKSNVQNKDKNQIKNKNEVLRDFNIKTSHTSKKKNKLSSKVLAN